MACVRQGLVVGGSGKEGGDRRELGIKIRDEQEKQIMQQNQNVLQAKEGVELSSLYLRLRRREPPTPQHLFTPWYPMLGQGTCRKINEQQLPDGITCFDQSGQLWSGGRHLPCPWPSNSLPALHSSSLMERKASPSVNKPLPGPHWSPGLVFPTQISFPSTAPLRAGCSIPRQSCLLPPGSR